MGVEGTESGEEMTWRVFISTPYFHKTENLKYLIPGLQVEFKLMGARDSITYYWDDFTDTGRYIIHNVSDEAWTEFLARYVAGEVSPIITWDGVEREDETKVR